MKHLEAQKTVKTLALYLEESLWKVQESAYPSTKAPCYAIHLNILNTQDGASMCVTRLVRHIILVRWSI